MAPKSSIDSPRIAGGPRSDSIRLKSIEIACHRWPAMRSCNWSSDTHHGVLLQEERVTPALHLTPIEGVVSVHCFPLLRLFPSVSVVLLPEPSCSLQLLLGEAV